ncbi:acetyltransferase, partial [Vibrio cholerae]|nr:acetyltransferase [Vibrio cholerae]
VMRCQPLRRALCFLLLHFY